MQSARHGEPPVGDGKATIRGGNVDRKRWLIASISRISVVWFPLTALDTQSALGATLEWKALRSAVAVHEFLSSAPRSETLSVAEVCRRFYP